MFSNLPHKKIPGSLNDCMQANPTASHLTHWASEIEQKGLSASRMVWVLGSLLAIAAFILLVAVNVWVALLVTAAIFVGTASTAASRYTTYHMNALKIGAMASIVQSTTVSANTALYVAAHGSAPQGAPQGSGAAGSAPSKASSAPHPAGTTPTSAPNTAPSQARPMPFWTCKSCSKLNSSGNSVCQHCGAKK